VECVQTAPKYPFSPYDLTITPIPGGHLIGRVLERDGPGPWWECVETFATIDAALRRARELAAVAKVRVWLSGASLRFVRTRAGQTSPLSAAYAAFFDADSTNRATKSGISHGSVVMTALRLMARSLTARLLAR
jgi:hypothetical protein